MNDVVYLLSKGSTWQNNELRYSLRSIEKNIINFRNLIIIGEKPEFLIEGNYTHIPFQDVHSNKARNIKDKIYHICKQEWVSDQFMLMNDDYFILQQIDATSYPYYHKCKLQETMLIQRGEYTRHVEPTFYKLREDGYRTHNYDVHRPIIYDKKLFVEVMDRYDWNRPYGFVIRSLYCNVLKLHGPYKKDCKISWAMVPEKWVKFTEDKDCLSIDDKSINEHFIGFIERLFPHKSRFEI